MSPAGDKSSCNVWDLRLITGLGRSSGEGKATHSSILVWRISNSIHCIAHGIAKSQTWLSNFHFPRRIKESTEEINQNIYRWRNISCSWIGLIDRVKMYIPPKAINRFNTIPLELPKIFFIKLEQIILRFAWKHIRPWRAKAVLSKNETRGVKFSDFRLHYKDMKEVWNLHKHYRPMEQSIKSKDRFMHPLSLTTEAKMCNRKRHFLQKVLLGKLDSYV